MNLLQSLLDLDLELLQSARNLVTPEYATLIQLLWEAIVITGAIFLIALWLYGAYVKDHKYKRIALSIFYTIIFVFLIYAIVNLGIPKWRLWAMEIPGAIAPLIPHPIDNSFPSGHALFTGALMVWMCRYFYRNYLLALFIIVWFITLSCRVIGWVHYPWDILGWLILGSITWIIIKQIVDLAVIKTSPIFIKIASWFKL